MISQVLSLWKTKNGLDSEGDYVYGIFDDIGFSINDEAGGKLLVISVIALSAESYKKIQELCKMMGGCFSSVKIGRVEDYLALFIPDGVPGVTVTDLDNMVQFVAANYAGAGFVAHTKCFKCGQPSSRLTFKDQLVRPVCNSCASSGGIVSAAVNDVHMTSIKQEPIPDNNDFSNNNKGYDTNGWDDDGFDVKPSNDNFQLNEDAFENNYGVEFDFEDHHSGKGSLIGGFFGALIGAAIGVVPFILIYTLFGSVISAGCILTSVVATLIYMLFKGKHSTGIGGVLIIICSALSSAAGTLYVLGKQYIESADSEMGLMEAVSKIAPSSIAVQLIIAIVGSILGFFVLIKAFSNYCED